MHCETQCNIYRLADIVSGYFSRHYGKNSTTFVCGKWPRSIGCEYLKTKKNVCDIIKKRSNYYNQTKDKLVVHLRLGDVLDWPYYIHKRKCSEKGCYYIHPISFYQQVNISKYIKNIEIISNPYYRYIPFYGSYKSIMYRDQVKKVFEKRGYNVTYRKSLSVDDDFLYMYNSINFLPGKGGFSNLVTRCKKLL